MSNNVKSAKEFTKHAVFEGVFVKHFFAGDDTDGRLNNLEVMIIPGFQISPHVHDNAGEYLYVVDGIGEFLDNDVWVPIKKGDAFMAPMGMTHGIGNAGNDILLLFSTFSPPIR